MPHVVTLGVVGFLAWLFASAGLHKLRAPRAYAGLLSRYLPGLPAVAPVALCLGALEVVVAVALLLPASRAVATLAAVCLLLAYAGGMVLQLLRGEGDMRCGCGGADSALLISPSLVLRNLICAGLGAAAFLDPVRVDGGWPGVVMALCIAIFLVLANLSAEQLIGNSQQLAEDL